MCLTVCKHTFCNRKVIIDLEDCSREEEDEDSKEFRFTHRAL